jgi:hypothetical protein
MKKNIFRTLFVSTFVAGATLFAACDEEVGIVFGIDQSFESTYAVEPFTGTSINKIDTISFNLDSVLAENNADTSNIESIEFKGLTVAIVDSLGNTISTQNFSNFRELNASIGGLNSPMVQIANMDSVTLAPLVNNNPLTFPNSTIIATNLVPYISASSFIVQLNSRIGSPITSKLFIKSTITVKINAKI